MPVTTMQNMINPVVMGDMVNAKIEAQLKMTPYAKVDTSLEGVPGDTKKIPCWGYIGDAENLAENSEITYTEMSASTKSFTIGKAAKGVTITTEAINSGLGDPVGQAETQLAKSIAGKVENDVVNAALGATMIHTDTAHSISYNGLVEAATKFEDEEDGIEKVLFIHPKQEAALLKDSSFLSADKFTAGVAVNGAIGKAAGCWIKKSKRIPFVPAVTAVDAVAGVYEFTITTKAAAYDRVKVNQVELIAGDSNFSLSTDTAAGNAAALAEALNASDDASVSGYTWSSSGAKLTATEDTGKEGTLGAPVITLTGSVKATAGVVTATAGVKKVDAVPAHYDDVIIKMEPDNEETEYTENELPAITILLKKDTTVTPEYNKDFDRYEIAAFKYYGVSLTNESKVVVAKFGE